MQTTTPHATRPIRSFVRREGRLTRGQTRALEQLWPRYGLTEQATALDFVQIFGRQAPVILEIGFGNGASLATQAQQMPDYDFIGIEVHRPGIGHLLGLIEQQGLPNLRISDRDAVLVLKEQIAPASLDRIQIFFPDPWQKKRHHKRRLIQAAFVALLATRLRPGGLLHLATDWPDYAQQMQTVLDQATEWFTPHGPQPLPQRPAERPATKFEQRGQARGHPVVDFQYQRH